METQQQKTPAYGKPQADVRSPRYGFQSPNVRTRVQEKEELSELNNRLCVYIDRMRYLESQNTKLHAEITTSKESKSKEFEDVKHMYEAELSSARKLIDDTSKERASIQIENNKLKLAVDDLNNRLEKEVAARSRAEDELKRVERRLHEKESLNAVLSKERKDLERQVKDLESQLKETQDALQELRAEHERESIRRADAENRLLTLQEEMDFKEDVHNKEVIALQNHAESMNLNLKITGEADDNYDNILRDKLQEIREEFEEEGETLKEELEQAYRSKYDAMCADNEKGRSQVSDLQESNSALKTELNCIKSDYGVLESKVTQLQRRISELSNLRKIDGEEYARKLEAKDFKISELQTKIEELENEYENLLSIKVALDVEIAAYRKLLEGEEERLNMTPSPHRSASSSRRGTKRSRVEETTIENESVGSIEVVECEPTGKFISIQNKSDKDEPLGGWYLQQIVNGQEENAVEFKFTPKYVLKANAKVTIWSESSGMKQKPPSDLVLKKMDWSYGAQVVTQVINPDAEIVAKQTLIPTPPSTETRRARKRRSGNQNRESCLMM